LRRYLANKINDTFAEAEGEIRATSEANASTVVQDVSGLLIPFCQRILGEAIETDRRLKGSGFPDPKYQSQHALSISFLGDIEARKRSMVAFYHREPLTKQSLSMRVEKFVEKNKVNCKYRRQLWDFLG
jgi:hypothetical protein